MSRSHVDIKKGPIRKAALRHAPDHEDVSWRTRNFTDQFVPGEAVRDLIVEQHGGGLAIVSPDDGNAPYGAVPVVDLCSEEGFDRDPVITEPANARNRDIAKLGDRDLWLVNRLKFHDGLVAFAIDNRQSLTVGRDLRASDA